ncbi:MAG: glycerophosphodiester phosphodiesterase [Vicingaceae bacterium]
MKSRLHLLSNNKLHCILVFLAICISSCVSYDKSELENLNDNAILRIGHAGSGFSSWIPFNPYPANSFTSLKKAIIEQKADGVEVDVHMTADGQFVLYHDNKLESKTNLTGCISELNYNDVVKAEYQLGAPFDWFQAEKVIGLDSLIQFLKQQKPFPHLQLDIRHSSDCISIEENRQRRLAIIGKLIETLNAQNVPIEKVLLISLSKDVIEEAKKLNCPYALSFEETTSFEQNFEWVKEMNLPYLTIKPSLLSAEHSAIAHEAGVRIITFGAKSKSGNKRLLKLNPDVIQTNNLNALGDLLQN